MQGNKWIYTFFLLIFETFLLQAGEWSDQSIIKKGQKIYANNCAVCHGVNLKGNPSLRRKGSAPPALDGSGHVTHHSPATLMAHIRDGGKGGKEWMPAFKGILNRSDRKAVLIYIHSRWPKKVRKHYDKKFNIFAKDKR